MSELYDYRLAYNALLFNEWHKNQTLDVAKSLKHDDGEPCFGGSHFVVYAVTPHGQVTNHYRLKHWDLFDIPEVERAPKYDGHTPQIALERMMKILSDQSNNLGK